jgi:Protein of unknown function (DUF4231)
MSELSDDSHKNSYKQNRLEDQITWYSKKAQHNKIRFRLCQAIILVAGSTIPIINVAGFGDMATRITSSVIGALIATATGVTQLEKYQENWIVYRTTSELLKKEKYFFENNAGDYSKIEEEEEKRKILVERVEGIVSSETSKYFYIHQPPQKVRKED